MTTVNKEISNSTELLEFEHNTIIDCKVKLQNIFTKELPGREIGVFGDYDILVFYRHDSRRKSNYEVKTIRKTFNEIVLATDILKSDDTSEEGAIEIEEVLFIPTCEFKLKNKHHNDSTYEIEVLGSIKITYSLKGEDITKKNNSKVEIVQNVQKHNELPKLKEEVFQFQSDDKHSIEELMNMDLESLKKISKED